MIYSIKAEAESIRSLRPVLSWLSPCCRARRSPAGWRWRGGSCSSGSSGGLPPPRRCRSRPSSSGRLDPRWQEQTIICGEERMLPQYLRDGSFNKSFKAYWKFKKSHLVISNFWGLTEKTEKTLITILMGYLDQMWCFLTGAPTTTWIQPGTNPNIHSTCT